MNNQEDIVNILKWYAEEAGAIARKLNGKSVIDNPEAVCASLTVLALDGGKRAREAISMLMRPA